jgi:hypothetical protein
MPRRVTGLAVHTGCPAPECLGCCGYLEPQLQSDPHLQFSHVQSGLPQPVDSVFVSLLMHVSLCRCHQRVEFFAVVGEFDEGVVDSPQFMK